MSYINDPREMAFSPESGVILEQDNRHEEKYHWGAMIVDLCDLPVEEYMKPMTVICLGSGGGEVPDTTYTLKFVIDGVTVAQESLKSGDSIPFSINAEKDGRNFLGWYYGNTQYTEGALMPSKSLTLTAKYSCDVKFIFVIDGVEEEVSAYTVNYNSKPASIPSTSKDGYKFLGWEPSITKEVKEHTVFKATFEAIIYSVTWNGYTDGPLKQEYKYGDTMITPVAPEKEGYTFKNWDKTIPSIVTNNLTFNAVFEVNKYKVTYNINWNNEIIPYTSFTVNYGSSIPTTNIPTEKGYSFSKWESSYTGNTVPAFDIEFTSVKSVNSYKLGYYVNNNLVKEESYNYLATITPYEYVPEEGYTATEWTGLPENLIMPYNNVSAYCTTEIMKFTVTFTDQNGNILSVKENVPYGTKFDTILPTIPEGYEYVFDESINGVVKENVNIEVQVSIGKYRVFINGESVLMEYNTNIREYVETNYKPEEGYNLNITNITHETVPGKHDIAVVEFTFEPNIWVLSYATEGADENLNGSVNVPYGTSVLNSLPSTDKEHYEFGGWFNNGTLITSEFTMPNNDLSVNGNYLVNSYTVRVIDENNEEIISKIYSYKTKLNIVLSENEVVEYINSQTGYVVNFTVNGENINDTMIVNGNVDILAYKTPEKYTLTFKNGNEVISSTKVEYGSVISYPAMENKTEAGVEYVFVWEDESYNGETMPAMDLTIIGNYQEKAEAPIYYGIFTTSAHTTDSVLFNEEEFIKFNEVSVTDCLDDEKITIHQFADEYLQSDEGQELSDEEWDAYVASHLCPHCILIPAETFDAYTVEVYDAANMKKAFVTDKVKININGTEYYLYVYLNNEGNMVASDSDWDYNYTIKLIK